MNAYKELRRVDPYEGSTRATGERNDCTVRTTTFLLDIRYDDAHALLESWGRKRGRGFRFHTVAEKLKLVERPEFRRRRVKTVLGSLPYGHFAVLIRHHVFAVVNKRVVSDAIPTRPLRVVRKVFEYLRSERLPVLKNKI